MDHLHHLAAVAAVTLEEVVAVADLAVAVVDLVAAEAEVVAAEAAEVKNLTAKQSN